jgi:hypothetical protein
MSLVSSLLAQHTVMAGMRRRNNGHAEQFKPIGEIASEAMKEWHMRKKLTEAEMEKLAMAPPDIPALKLLLRNNPDGPFLPKMREPDRDWIAVEALKRANTGASAYNEHGRAFVWLLARCMERIEVLEELVQEQDLRLARLEGGA